MLITLCSFISGISIALFNLLIMLLLPPHQRLFECWQQLHSNCEFFWENSHDLLSVKKGWSELMHVLTQFITSLLLGFIV